MTYIDVVIAKLHTLTDKQRAIWHANAERVIARGPRRNAAYADALRLRHAIGVFETTRPAENRLINVAGLDWDRFVAGRSTFRAFDGDRLVAEVTRSKRATFIVAVIGSTTPHTCTSLCAARVVAADKYATQIKSAAQFAQAA